MTDELITSTRVAFVQLVKYDRDSGAFEGVMASSAPDQTKEILDWETSKPHFQRWFSSFHKRTGGASLGNVREMHQPHAAGKLTWVKFDDPNERILVRGKVVDGETRRKVEEAVLTGLSIGGEYGKRWSDPQKPGYTRYTALPHEVSLVDNPCNPDATLTIVGGGGEKIMKFAMASTELEADEEDDDLGEDTLAKAVSTRDGERLTAKDYAHTPDPAHPSTWKFRIDDADHVNAALGRWGQDKDIPDAARRKAWRRILAAADRFGVAVKDRTYKVEGAKTMSESSETVVREELRKQELVKAAKHAALGKILKAVKKLRKTVKRKGQSGGLTKTYVDTVGGYLNDLAGQIASLQAAFTPAVAAGMPQYSGKLNPDETTAGASGEMVTDSPSGSGEAEMVAGAGNRKFKGKGKMKKLAKLIAAVAENQATMEKRVADTLTALLKPPTADELAKAAKVDGGAPVRLVKEAPDDKKIAKADDAKTDEVSETVIRSLQEKASDASDPVGAAKAQAELNKITEAAVAKALVGTAQATSGQAGFRTPGLKKQA